MKSELYEGTKVYVWRAYLNRRGRDRKGTYWGPGGVVYVVFGTPAGSFRNLILPLFSLQTTAPYHKVVDQLQKKYRGHRVLRTRCFLEFR